MAEMRALPAQLAIGPSGEAGLGRARQDRPSLIPGLSTPGHAYLDTRHHRRELVGAGSSHQSRGAPMFGRAIMYVIPQGCLLDG